jgi:RNA polymerase sigma factor (sigma-70 family)
VTPDERSDGDILRLSRVQPELLGTIYERHAAAVFRFVARRVGPAAAEDLLGDVFIAAVAARTRVRVHQSGSALPWLYGIAGNVVRSHLRQRMTAVPPDGETVDWGAVDDRLDARAQRDDLRLALGALTEVERDLLLLVAWEGLSPAEAAEVLGITAVAARSRLHRARTRAQAALNRLSPLERM